MVIVRLSSEINLPRDRWRHPDEGHKGNNLATSANVAKPLLHGSNFVTFQIKSIIIIFG